jgi:hypothetical protein
MNEKKESIPLLLVAIALLLSVGIIALLAFNVRELWTAWYIAFGIFIGKIVSLGKARLAYLICGLILIVIVGYVVVRALPLHSLPWRDADRLEISVLHEDWKIELTDPKEIAEFATFGESGHYQTMLKSGYGYHIYVTQDSVSTGYYIHGNAIGDMPGGAMQSVFVPKKEGFVEYFEGILAKYGHARR